MEGCRKYANVLRGLYGILAGVIALALMIISNELANWWIFIGGCLIFALWFVIVFAYAAHLDAVATQIEQNEKIIALLAGEKPEETKPAAVQAPKEQNENSAEKRVADSAETPSQNRPCTEKSVIKAPVVDENGFLVCPLCKTKQRAGRGVCFECGVKFEL